jgi:hypothetical protein
MAFKQTRLVFFTRLRLFEGEPFFAKMTKAPVLVTKSGKMLRQRRSILLPQPASRKNAGAFFCEAG